MKINLFIAGILTVASFPLANAQAPSAGAPANRDPSEISGVGSTANFGQLVNQQHGSMQYFGKVVVDGGGLPWNPIPIAVVCDGKTRYNTVTDAKGGFGIMVDAKLSESELVQTKADVGRVTAAQLVGCKVNAVLDGFDSTPVTIANRDVTDSPDIGTIHLHHNDAAAGSSISSTTASAPADAMKEFEKAHSDEIANHMDSARKHLQKAVSIYPQFAEAWYQVGRLEETDKPDDALNAYQKAAAADPKYTPPYEHIATICAVEKKWQDVVDATNHALQLVPAGTPQIWYYNAVGNFNLKNVSVAQTAAEKSLSMDPNHLAPNTEQLLAVMLAGQGEYQDALDHLRHCLTYMPPGPSADLIKQQVAQLEKMVPPAAK
jgi:cytochrome c-type biogenesis protein CcmH/NrfG